NNVLDDGTTRVDVINNSTTSLRVLGGSHGVGSVNGIGNTTVNAGATLTATRVRQNALTVNGTLVIRSTATGTSVAQEAGSAASTSVIDNALNVVPGGTIDLTNNDLIVRNASFSTISDLVKSGFGPSGAWNGTGITSSTANSHSADGTRTLGVLTASDGS